MINFDNDKTLRICKNLFLMPLSFIFLILTIGFITNDFGILILLPFYIIPSVLFGLLYLVFKGDLKKGGGKNAL